MQLVMVRRRLCSITDVAPVAERACSSTARTPWYSAPSTQRRPSLQLVKVGRRRGSTTDVAHLGWARLLIDRMDTRFGAAPRVPQDARARVGFDQGLLTERRGSSGEADSDDVLWLQLVMVGRFTERVCLGSNLY